MKFEELNLNLNILRAVKAEGYTTPSEIQEAAIPPLLEGRDLIGCAQTGTGKTAAFALPIIQLLEKRGITPDRKIRSLILTPTRELAMQIFESFHSYGKYTKLKYGVIFGGVSQRPQEEVLRRGIDVLVATPGRLNDLINQGFVKLGAVEIFVLDEADRMLDMGFIHDVKKVIAQIPQNKQTLLFSATMPSEIKEIADHLMKSPITITVKALSSAVDTVSQGVYFVDKNNKQQLLTDILKERKPSSTLVFTRTKHGADKVVAKLLESGIQAAAIHGNKSQNNRQMALNNFKSGRIKVLVATDIAARGIDVDKLALVVNFELPNIPETYVHRIGRTGRAGQEGDSLSFCDYSEKPFLKDIEKLIKSFVPVIEDHAYPMAVFTVPPKEQRGGRGSRDQRPQGDQRSSSRTPKGQRSGPSRDSRSGDSRGQSKDSRSFSGESRGPAKDKRSFSGESRGPAKDSRSFSGESRGPAKDSRSFSGESRGPAKDKRSFSGESRGPAKDNRSQKSYGAPRSDSHKPSAPRRKPQDQSF